jgi:hypothetical protein
MSNPTDSAPSASPESSANKVDLITVPTVAMLVGVVLAALGNSRGSSLLTWQLPLGLMALALAWVGVKALRARRG